MPAYNCLLYSIRDGKNTKYAPVSYEQVYSYRKTRKM